MTTSCRAHKKDIDKVIGFVFNSCAQEKLFRSYARFEYQRMKAPRVFDKGKTPGYLHDKL